MKKICVIGAGAAGLCAARHSLAKQWEVVVYEKSGQIGGTWIYSEQTANGEPVHSSMYKNLMTNLPKEVMNFPNFPFSENLPSFMSHETVLDYLKSYANHYNIVPYIEFNREVKKVEPFNCQSSERWKITTKCSKSLITEIAFFDAVYVCNGHYSTPDIPKIEGYANFRGIQIHSHDYKEPKPFTDKRVACLGAGPSGVDIALELASTAEYVYLCHRKKPYVETEFPLNFAQKPSISSFNENSIVLTNGEILQVDVVLYCTGYQYSYDFFPPEFNLDVTARRVQPLYMHLVHAEYPTIFFIGLCFIINPFSHFDMQIRYCMSVLEGQTKLPSKDVMVDWIKEDYRYRMDNVNSKQMHYLGEMQWKYLKDLAALANLPNQPDVLEKIYTFVHAFRLSHLTSYRSLNFKIIDDNTFTYYLNKS